MEWLGRGIQDIIHKFKYSFYVIQQDFNIKCPCVHHSDQPDPGCMLCLGTGFKIYIREMQGYSEDMMQSIRQSFSSEPVMSRDYYICSHYLIRRKNIIVEMDEKEAYNVHEMERLTSVEKDKIYQLCYTYPKKTDNGLFIKNFEKIIRRGD